MHPPDCLVSSSVGADPNCAESLVDGAASRYFTSSMVAGFSVGDLTLGRVPKNLVHRCGIPPLLLSRTPFSSMTNCYPPIASR